MAQGIVNSVESLDQCLQPGNTGDGAHCEDFGQFTATMLNGEGGSCGGIKRSSAYIGMIYELRRRFLYQKYKGVVMACIVWADLSWRGYSPKALWYANNVIFPRSFRVAFTLALHPWPFRRLVLAFPVHSRPFLACPPHQRHSLFT